MTDAPSPTPGEDQVVAWRWRWHPDIYGDGAKPGRWHHDDRHPADPVGTTSRREVQPLVPASALSAAQGEIAVLVGALSALMPAVQAYLLTGDVMTQSIKKQTWGPSLTRANQALAAVQSGQNVVENQGGKADAC